MFSALSIPSDHLLYDSKFETRGTCLLINNSMFKNPKLGERNGSEHDVQRVTECFTNLGFNVKKVLDETRRNIIKEVINAAKDPMNEKSQCFACVVMTHGNLEELAASDDEYDANYLFEYFNGIHCPSLAGKPKIFIIQACRGDRIDDGAIVAHTDDAETKYYRISSNSDFLIVYSSFAGFKSYRNPMTGSYFITYLTSVLNDCPHDVDVLSLLSRVNRLVSYEFESNKDHGKQTPCIVSTLTRQLFFAQLINNE